MCKYCEIDKESKCASEPLADGKYEACRIVIYNGAYCISIYGSGEDWSDPIKFCPFCGRELKVEENNSEGFTNICDYIKSLDTPETYEKWRYAYDLWIKYHDNRKNPDDYLEEIINKVGKKFK